MLIACSQRENHPLSARSRGFACFTRTYTATSEHDFRARASGGDLLTKRRSGWRGVGFYALGWRIENFISELIVNVCARERTRKSLELINHGAANANACAPTPRSC